MDPVPGEAARAASAPALPGPAADRSGADGLARYAPIFDSMLEGVLMADATGAVVAANEPAARIFGVPRDGLLDAMQRFPERFALRVPGSGAVPKPIGTRALEGEIVQPVERLIRAPDGAERHLRTSAAPIRDPAGAIVGAVILIADVTAERGEAARARQHAQELREAYEAARDAIRQRDDVLSVVSHDVRSPLGVVSLATRTIAQIAQDERVRRAAGNAHRAAQRVRRLIDDLVTVARARGGELSLQLGETTAAAILEELVATFEEPAAQRGIALRTELADPGAPLVCDADRVVEALSNYVSNAISVTPAGGVVTIRTERAGGELVFSVRDPGPGIAPPDLARVFERGFRAPDVAYPGTGLGLAIAKAIADAHRGRVWAESGRGQGSAFHLALPAGPR